MSRPEFPDFIGNYLNFLDEDNASYPGSDELLSIGSAVGKKLGLIKIGIHIETLPPGRRTSWPHAENEEEEFTFVIEGTPDAWINGNLHRLSPGDFVSFPSGTGIAHTFINNSSTIVKLLVGGEATKPTTKVFYPMHPARNQTIKEKSQLWEDCPKQLMGDHDGLPDLLRGGNKSPKWNLPTIESQRLILRPLELSDAEAMFEYAYRSEVAEFVSWEPHKSSQDSERLIKLLQTNYLQAIPDPMGIVLKTDPTKIIGTIGLFWNTKQQKTMEQGAVLHPEHWGKGIIQEAFKALYPFVWQNYDVVRIQGRCKVGNVRSRRLMEKMGMEYEGTLRSSFFAKGTAWDMEVFSLIRNSASKKTV